MICRRFIFTLLLCFTAASCLLCIAIARRSAKAATGASLAIAMVQRVVPQQRTRGGQRSRRTNRRLPIRRSSRIARASGSYRNFEHDTATHRSLACASCHQIESVRRIDVVEYPDHDACISCHRQQFFNGARPNICTICHTVVSPRNGSRFQFPKPAVASEFSNIFPHDKHQFVIAELAPAHRTPNEARFTRVSFTHGAQDPPKSVKPIESCATCHVTDTTERPKPTEWIEDKELNTPGKIEPVPTAGTFKRSPEGHASCFNCHWQNQQPVAADCAGCHNLSTMSRPGTKNPHSAVTNAASNQSSRPSRTVAAALKVTTMHSPDVWLERISAKFRHEREDHKGFSCSSCHTNILEAASLADLAAEVPIATCSGCHAGTRKDIQKELDSVKSDPKFNCAYCHLSNVGSRDIPTSHFAIVGRAPTQMRTEAQSGTRK